MERDDSLSSTVETIQWQQWKRCGLDYCSQDYILYNYRQDGNPSNPVVKVYIAKGMDPPMQFSTTGGSSNQVENAAIKGKLYFGLLNYDNWGLALFFVIHPNDWFPYQYRFKTNHMKEFIQAEYSVYASSDADRDVLLGTMIFPGDGDEIGGSAGDAIASSVLTEENNFLRFIG